MKPWDYIAIGCVLASLLVSAFFIGRATAPIPHVEPISRDTTVKVVTVYKDFPQPVKTADLGYVSVPSYKFLSDTITREIAVFLHDTTVVYLPRERKYYEEENGSLRLWVSGYDPRLDKYELDKAETEITNTITVKTSRWSVGIMAGYGAQLAEKGVTLSPFIGIGVTYNFLQW